LLIQGSNGLLVVWKTEVACIIVKVSITGSKDVHPHCLDKVGYYLLSGKCQVGVKLVNSMCPVTYKMAMKKLVPAQVFLVAYSVLEFWWEFVDDIGVRCVVVAGQDS